MLIDTHCHLDFPEFDADRDEVIRRAKDKGIEYIINIGSSIEGSKKSLDLSSRYNSIYAAIGLHPHEADTFGTDTRSVIEGLAKKDKVVAIGEIGLDYYKNYSKQDNQRALFSSLLGLANDLGLPVVIHSRQAENDTLKIMQAAMPVRVVLHCFSGDKNFLNACLDLGFFISFTCNITYKKAQNLRDLVKLIPLDRLMLETDAPFLPPEGYRGRRNEPLYVGLLAQEISRIKEISLEELSLRTTDNAKRFFKLK